MENSNLYHSDYSVYPGQYVPLLTEEVVKEELTDVHEGDSILPPVNVKELPHSYKVEVAIPGIKREEFLIRGVKNVLSIMVIHADSETKEKGIFHLHEFNYQCFDREIVLPKNADAAFAVAKYKGGVLYLYISKTCGQTYIPAEIIVY